MVAGMRLGHKMGPFRSLRPHLPLKVIDGVFKESISGDCWWSLRSSFEGFGPADGQGKSPIAVKIRNHNFRDERNTKRSSRKKGHGAFHAEKVEV